MCTEPTLHVESTHPEVIAFAQHAVAGATSTKQKAVALYYAVRDGIRYDPYVFDISTATLRASYTLRKRRSWCVPKAILLAACCRSQGIPARLGFADVRNHLSTQRLREMMGTDVFAWHGYTLIDIDGRWLKTTPAFNIELCEKFKLRPLEFDGESHALYHPYDLEGHRHMDYIRERGEFDDVPLEQMLASLRECYPTFAEYLSAHEKVDADFDADVEAEVSR